MTAACRNRKLKRGRKMRDINRLDMEIGSMSPAQRNKLFAMLTKVMDHKTLEEKLGYGISEMSSSEASQLFAGLDDTTKLEEILEAIKTQHASISSSDVEQKKQDFFENRKEDRTQLVTYQGIAPSTWTDQQIELMKNYIAKGFTDDEFKILLYTAWRTHLDPLRKQIWGWKQKNKNGKDELIILTSIHGKLGKADATGKYDGYDTEKEYDKDGHVVSITCIVHRKDQSRPTIFKALRTEYDKKHALWLEKPEMMLEKCALSMALSRAFPEELGGLYVPEEMGSAKRVDVEVD